MHFNRMHTVHFGNNHCPDWARVSVQGVSVKRGLCPGRLCPRVLCPGGWSLLRVSLSRGVSVQGGLCPGGSVSGSLFVQRGSLSPGLSLSRGSLLGGSLDRDPLCEG